jgi:hypothetical protein
LYEIKDQNQTKQKKKKHKTKKNFPLYFSTVAGEMNIPAKLTSPSINNARLSDHRRHVFHETPFLQVITFLA